MAETTEYTIQIPAKPFLEGLKGAALFVEEEGYNWSDMIYLDYSPAERKFHIIGSTTRRMYIKEIEQLEDMPHPIFPPSGMDLDNYILIPAYAARDMAKILSKEKNTFNCISLHITPVNTTGTFQVVFKIFYDENYRFETKNTEYINWRQLVDSVSAVETEMNALHIDIDCLTLLGKVFKKHMPCRFTVSKDRILHSFEYPVENPDTRVIVAAWNSQRTEDQDKENKYAA